MRLIWQEPMSVGGLPAGGDALYLCHWMQQSGLADLFPSLHETVYVGMSAGSIVLTPCIGKASSAGSRPPVATARWASLIPQFFRTWITRTSPNNSMANAEWWAAGIPNPAYAIDDQTAIKVTSGTVEVVSEGQLEAVHPSPQASQPA